MTYTEWILVRDGKGMRQPDDYEHPGLAKVKEMWERGEFDKIDKMVKFWTALENLGIVGGMIKHFIIWLGIVATGYLTLTGHLTEWIRSIK